MGGRDKQPHPLPLPHPFGTHGCPHSGRGGRAISLTRCHQPRPLLCTRVPRADRALGPVLRVGPRKHGEASPHACRPAAGLWSRGRAAGPEEPGARLGRVPHQPAALARGWSAPFADQYQPIDFHSDRMKGSANDSKKPGRPRPDAINPARLRWPRHGPYDDRMALF